MKRTLLALTAASALALTGCSGNSSPNSEEAPSSPEGAETQSESTPLSQEEWIELCAPDGGTNPDDPKCTEDLGDGDEEGMPDDEELNEKQGEWFEFTTTDADDYIENWQVRIDTAEVVDVLPKAADNADWDGGDEIPEYIDAKPEDGNEFLHVEYSVKNNNQKATYLALEPSVMFSDGEVFSPLGADADEYAPNLTQHRDNPAGEEQNPKTETQGDFVIEIPEDSDIDSLIIADAYLGSEAEWVVDLELSDS